KFLITLHDFEFIIDNTGAHQGQTRIWHQHTVVRHHTGTTFSRLGNFGPVRCHHQTWMQTHFTGFVTHQAQSFFSGTYTQPENRPYDENDDDHRHPDSSVFHSSTFMFYY